MPIVQINWTKISSLLDGATEIYFLTNRQAAILRSLAEQLHWEKTFRPANDDEEIKDEIDLEIADLEHWLSMPVSITDLIGYIDEIEDLLKALQTIGITGSGCCDNMAPLSEKHTTDNDPATSDVPAYYGAEPITDRDDWYDLICGSAHAYVELLKGTTNELQGLLVAGAVAVGAIAGILGLLSGAGILLAVGYGVGASTTTAFLETILLGVLDGVEDDIEDAREAIVCAIVNGSYLDLKDAVEDAVSATAWIGWFSMIDYESAWSTIIDGSNGQGNLTPIRGESCECVEPDSFCGPIPNCSWRQDASQWTLSGGITWSNQEYSNNGFDVDGVIQASATPTGQDARSANFTWPGGRPSFKVVARSACTGTIAAQNTYVVIRLYRASDNALMGTYSTTHGGGNCVVSLQTGSQETSNIAAGEYYIKVAIDGGLTGYNRHVDYIGMVPYGT